jgi:predicted aspartyl protease
LSLILLGACTMTIVRDPPPAASAPAIAMSAQDFETALQRDDFQAVLPIASDAHASPAERNLAQAALDYWLRQDRRAGEELTRASSDAALPETLRRRASLMLSGLRLRQGRYTEAAALIHAALPGVTDEKDRTDLQQTLTFVTPLASAPPMRATVNGAGTIMLTRDATGHMRAPVTINGGALDVIVDTGSGVSSITVGNARRLGLRPIGGNAVVGTATSANVTAGLAIADHLTFGGTEFSNVVFLVVPDQQFVFANGAYVVQGIIGLPLLMELGRLEFENHGATETLRYRRTDGTPNATSNLNVDGVQPYTYAAIEGAERKARFFIDNGAPTTHVNRRFPLSFPSAMTNARHEAVTAHGGAGSETQADGMVLPTLTLHFGDTPVTLSEVRVFDDHQTERDGDIGADVLNSGGGYVLDFDAMRLEILPPR